eukprot:scaffold256268_cov35-Prasinocladus_malaysianus.AAC.1
MQSDTLLQVYRDYELMIVPTRQGQDYFLMYHCCKTVKDARNNLFVYAVVIQALYILDFTLPAFGPEH